MQSQVLRHVQAHAQAQAHTHTGHVLTWLPAHSKLHPNNMTRSKSRSGAWQPPACCPHARTPARPPARTHARARPRTHARARTHARTDARTHVRTLARTTGQCPRLRIDGGGILSDFVSTPSAASLPALFIVFTSGAPHTTLRHIFKLGSLVGSKCGAAFL